MSLNRIVTRIAAVSALTNFGKAPWPTFAKGLIYDSRIEPSEQLERKGNENFQKPIAVVYTDYDKDFFIFRNKLQASRMMTITIELLVVQAAEQTYREGEEIDVYELETPTTDSELETTLDLFERQVFLSLQADNEAGTIFNRLVLGYENVISRRGAAVTGGQRLAARQITIETDLARDPQPGILPDYTAAFLDRCINEPKSDFAVRAAMLKGIYLDSMGMTAADFDSRSQGVRIGDLGRPERPYSLLPPQRNIEWVDPVRRGP